MNTKFCIIIIGIFILAGCSSDKSMVSPDLNPQSDELNAEFIGVIAEEISSDGSIISGSGALGLFQVIIDPGNLEAEMTNLRSGALDDTVEIVDITNFLTVSPCTDCARIESIELDSDSHIVLKMGIKHPFPAGDSYKPITAVNRGDLHVFNIEGTVIFDDESDSTQFPGIGTTIGPSYLINADGYSPYLDNPLDEIFSTSAKVHPYILHFDDYSTGNFNPSSPNGFESLTTPGPSGNLVMRMGAEYDVQDYIFDIAQSEPIEFIYAIGCTYSITAQGKVNRFNSEYQIPQHNKKAASEVSVEIVNNALESGDMLSTADLEIKVLDISHGVAVGEGLDQMKADSSISAISLEIPGIIPGASAVSTTPSGGDGRDPMNPLTFPVTITNMLGASEGSYAGIVKVTDSYPPGLNEVLTGDAISRVDIGMNPIEGIYQLSEFATYQVFNIEISLISNTPPVAVLDADPAGLCPGDTVQYDASGSYDAEDDLADLMFEYDFEYDGTFTPDTLLSSDPTASYSAFIPGATFTTMVRVVDTGTLDGFASVEITVTPNPSSWVTDITDGTTIQNVVFHHSSRIMEQHILNRIFATESMSSGSGWIYLTFYTSDGSVYFTRSDNSGLTWDDPTLIASGITDLVGSAIDAADSTIFIVYAEEDESTITLLKNTNAGEGSWESFNVADYPPLELISNLGVSVDPSDPNYVYIICYHRDQVEGYYPDGYHLLKNSSGGSGAWNETFTQFFINHNGRQMEVEVASDGTVYIGYLQNTYVSILRSDDHGQTFTVGSYPGNSQWTRYWAAEMDMCVDPNDPDVVYVVWGTQGTNPPNYPTKILLMKTINRGNTVTLLQEDLIPVPQTNSRKPAVMVDPNGKVYVSFTYQVAPDDFDILVRSSCDGGYTFSDAVQFNLDDDGIDSDPEIAYDETSGAVLAWTENAYTDALGYNPSYNPNAKIVARHID